MLGTSANERTQKVTTLTGSFSGDEGAASDLLFRLVTGVVAVAVVVSLESQLVGRLFGIATALFTGSPN